MFKYYLSDENGEEETTRTLVGPYRSWFFFFTNVYRGSRSLPWKIGPWVLSSFGNPPDFTKFAEFHHEICRISCQMSQPLLNDWMQWISWNLVDFTMKSGRFHYEIQWISWNPLANFTLKSGGFHEIWQISWNPADFMADLEKCKLENVKFL